jgi:hypothetical protein
MLTIAALKNRQALTQLQVLLIRAAWGQKLQQRTRQAQFPDIFFIPPLLGDYSFFYTASHRDSW